MREAFSQIRGMMSDWRKKQETFDNTPDEDLETRVANLSALVEKMKASAMCRPPLQDDIEMGYLLEAIHNTGRSSQEQSYMSARTRHRTVT